MAKTRKQEEEQLTKLGFDISGIYIVDSNVLEPIRQDGKGTFTNREDGSILGIRKTHDGRMRLVQNRGIFEEEHLGILFEDKAGEYSFTLRNGDSRLGLVMRKITPTITDEYKEELSEQGLKPRFVQIIPKSYLKDSPNDEISLLNLWEGE